MALPPEAKQGLAIFATLLGSLALLAVVLTARERPAMPAGIAGAPSSWELSAAAVPPPPPPPCRRRRRCLLPAHSPTTHPRRRPCHAVWLLIFHLALKKLPPVQEALGLKKRDKPTLEEMRQEIEALKVRVPAGAAGGRAGRGVG